jgi:hypothetical protein
MSAGGQMTAAGQDEARSAAIRQPWGREVEVEVEVEVEEILPGNIDYRDDQGRAFHVWTVTRAGAGNKFGLGKMSEAQLRELGRQVGHLLGAAAPEGNQKPDRPREAATAALADVLTIDGTRDPVGRKGAGSGAEAGD